MCSTETHFWCHLLPRQDLNGGSCLKLDGGGNFFEESLGTHFMRLDKICRDQYRPDEIKPDHNMGLKKAPKLHLNNLKRVQIGTYKRLYETI